MVRRVFLPTLVILTAWGTASCRAQAPVSPPTAALKVAPAGGTSLLGPDVLKAFSLSGAAKDDATVRIVPVQGQAFTQALNVSTKRKPTSPWLIQLAASTASPVKKDDVILVSFWMRGVETGEGEGYVGIVFESNGEPFTQSVNAEASAGPQWQRCYAAFKAANDYAPGEAMLNLRLGYNPQTVEIGGISLVNYQQTVNVQDLPSTAASYKGRALNSPWRKAAQERIEKLRKGNLTLRVTNAAGKPVPGAQVAVHMKRHAFAFGSAVSASALISDTPANRDYQAKVKELFNEVVLENDLKWRQWEENREQALQGVKWLHNNGIRLRGHTLVWPGWRKLPPQLETLKNDKEALRRRIDEHIRDEVTATKGLTVDWDVINEVYKNHDLVDILGEPAMVDWFKAAKASDPKPTLYINDYGILSGGGNDTDHQNAYEKTIKYLIDNGAPIEGIGFQGHFGSRLTSPDKLLQILDHFARLGLKLKVTEFDIKTNDEALQGDYTRDFMMTLFSHPAVEGIVMWGFWEGRHYAPEAALWRKDWSLKPNGQAWLDLVKKQWWTDANGKTNAQGQYSTRGFLGDYEVTVSVGGRKKTVPLTLPKAGQHFTITLP